MMTGEEVAAAPAAVVAASTEAHRSEATVLDVHDLRVAAAVGQPVDVEAAAAAVVAVVVAVVVGVAASQRLTLRSSWKSTKASVNPTNKSFSGLG